jgi:Clp amino terminal domain, pathogenicity island component/NTF2 fold immunity protein
MTPSPLAQKKGGSMKRLALGIALIACLRVYAQNQPKTIGNVFTDIAQLEQPGAQRRTIMGMFERYTESARRVIFFARYEVSQSGGATIESEHLLLGLLREGGAVVSRFVRDATLADLRDEITGRMTVKEKVATSVDLPLSDECKRIIAYAAEEAERLNSDHIGPEHLLLGMLREEKSTAGQVLYRRGLKLNVVREELARAPMTQESAATSTQAPPDFSLFNNPVLPRAGAVADAEAAKRIAEAVWIPLYGAELIARQQPLHVEQKFNVWIVSGSAAPEAALFAFILQTDGRVLSLGRGSGKP